MCPSSSSAGSCEPTIFLDILTSSAPSTARPQALITEFTKQSSPAEGVASSYGRTSSCLISLSVLNDYLFSEKNTPCKQLFFPITEEFSLLYSVLVSRTEAGRNNLGVQAVVQNRINNTHSESIPKGKKKMLLKFPIYKDTENHHLVAGAFLFSVKVG